MDSLIVSGPTLTNVNDFRAILVEDPISLPASGVEKNSYREPK